MADYAFANPPYNATPYPANRSSKSCTTPFIRSSLYPVIGNGFAPADARSAATAIVAILAGFPCNAASVAALILTTDAMVAELPKDEKGLAGGMPGGGGMGGMGDMDM